MALSKELLEYAKTKAAELGIDPALAMATMQVESGFNPNATSPVGAGGMGQFMPGTAAQYGYKPEERYDPYKSIDMTTKHLADLWGQNEGNPFNTAAAYNAGQGNVDKYGGVPPFKETQGYVPKVMENFKNYQNQFKQEGYYDVPGRSMFGTEPVAANSGYPKDPYIQGAVDTPVQGGEENTEGGGKRNFMKDYLPLFLRFGLPTITGAVIGSKSPTFGALGGALTGLTGGGLGYLNSMGKVEEREAERSIASDKLRQDALKLKIDQGIATMKEQREYADLAEKIRSNKAGEGLKAQQLSQENELGQGKLRVEQEANVLKGRDIDTKNAPKPSKLEQIGTDFVKLYKGNGLTRDNFVKYLKSAYATDKDLPDALNTMLGGDWYSGENTDVINDMILQAGFQLRPDGTLWRKIR